MAEVFLNQSDSNIVSTGNFSGGGSGATATKTRDSVSHLRMWDYASIKRHRSVKEKLCRIVSHNGGDTASFFVFVETLISFLAIYVGVFMLEFEPNGEENEKS